MNSELISAGEKLILLIKNKTIVKDYRPDSGTDFHGGYEELYLNKFKQYLSSVGRYIRNQQLKDIKYNGYYRKWGIEYA